MDDELDPWPTPEEQAAFEADMAARPEEHPTPEQVEAMVEEWLRYFDRHREIADRYYETLRKVGIVCPF